MKKSRVNEEVISGILFAMPAILGLLIFTIGPIFTSLYISFTQYDILSSPKWIGIGNYREIFFEDSYFGKTLYNTAYYAFLSVPLQMIVALILALLLNQKIRGLAFYRTVYYLPSLISGVAVAMLWLWILEPYYGLLNTFLRYFGINGPLWLGDSKWAKFSLILMTLWGGGSKMIIFLAGLQGIPQQLYEAAELDGANSWSKFWNVTWPMITPVTFYNFVVGLIGSWQVFTSAYIMTQGGPRDSTLFYVLYLYKNAFEYFKMGYASALAWILFLIVLMLTLLIFKSSPAWVFYMGEMKR